MNSYLLALLSRYVYADGGGSTRADARFRTSFRRRVASWGVQTSRRNPSFVLKSGSGFDTQLAIVSTSEAVIIVFRGSESTTGLKFLRDWILTDANLIQESVPSLGRGVKLHHGFWRAFDRVSGELVVALQRHGVRARQPGPKKLWITGHSLGGALANVCAVWLRSQRFAVQGVHTYGGPRVGNAAHRNTYDRVFRINTQRWVNNNDVAAMLPSRLLHDYRHVGRTNNIRVDGSVRLNDRLHTGVGSAIDHSMSTYCQRIYARLSLAQRRVVPAPPR